MKHSETHTKIRLLSVLLFLCPLFSGVSCIALDPDYCTNVDPGCNPLAMLFWVRANSASAQSATCQGGQGLPSSFYTFLGGSGNETARSVCATTDGGLVTAGYTNANIASLGGKTPLNAYSAPNDFFVVKLKADGSVDWYTFLGGAGNDSGSALTQAADGGFVVAGYTNVNIAALGGKTPLNAYSALNDFLVVKLTPAGLVDWYTFLGSAGSDFGNALIQTGDGGFGVAGAANANIPSLSGKTPLNAYSASNDFLIVKLTPAGSVDWYTFLGGAGDETGSALTQAADGGFVVAGYSISDIPTLGGKTPLNAYSALSDFLVVRLTPAGSVDWYTFLGGAGDETGYVLTQAADGGFVVSGYTDADIPALGGKTPLNAYSASNDFLVVKITAGGTVDWYTILGGASNDEVYALTKAADGGFVVAGQSNGDIPVLGGKTPLNAYSAGFDFFLVKLKADGTM